MATYEELHILSGGNVLVDKIARAITISADMIVKESTSVPNHTNRLLWAKKAFEDPGGISKAVFNAMLAANKSSSVSVIAGASDTLIQANVDAVVDVFAGA